MKYKNIPFLYLLNILILPLLANTLSKNITNFTRSENSIIEISDKYDEVRLGLTNDEFYIVFSQNTKESVNKNLENEYLNSLQEFEDSNGNFINGSFSQIESNKLEIELDDISNLVIKSGRLNVKYKRKPVIQFEDITLSNGEKALDNFYLEDLESLIIAYKGIN